MTDTAPSTGAREQSVAIITGAGSGIGRATATLLSQHGYRLVLAGRHIDTLNQTGQSLTTQWLAVPTDVSDPQQATTLVKSAITHFGRLDVLINNAGLAPVEPIDQTTPGLTQQVFAVNALGPAYTIHAAWPIFIKQRSGCIVNISTMGTADPFPGFFAYAAAKSAVESMVRSCANEGKQANIRAFAVGPGAVETKMLRENFSEKQIPPSHTLAPEDIAQMIVDCVLGKRDNDAGKTIYVKS